MLRVRYTHKGFVPKNNEYVKLLNCTGQIRELGNYVTVRGNQIVGVLFDNGEYRDCSLSNIEAIDDGARFLLVWWKVNGAPLMRARDMDNLMATMDWRGDVPC